MYFVMKGMSPYPSRHHGAYLPPTSVLNSQKVVTKKLRYHLANIFFFFNTLLVIVYVNVKKQFLTGNVKPLALNGSVLHVT